MDFSKYPFLKKAKEQINEKDLLNPNEYVLDTAKQRIEATIKYGRYPINQDPPIIFYIARLLVELTKNSYIKERFAIGFAKAIYEHTLAKKERIDNELNEIIKNFNIDIRTDPLSIDSVDFLKYSPLSPDYALYYRKITDGYVLISMHELKRILQEAIKKHLLEPIPLDAIKENVLYNRFAEELQKLPKFTKPKINKVTKHPPCIEAILNDLYAHKNLSHYHRWVLAVYLYNIGVDKEKVIKLFSYSPDYNEKITRYQVDAIFKKGYKMPSTQKMKAYGICNDCACEKAGFTNPMQWVIKYGRKRKTMDKRKV